ncbi:phytoene desaturase family protein [Dictyobacter formicarum]|uniref:NAD(P)/FAD-dependent oxidoreductase n=1 Tax=Dictyobacter formicarum TaxID=2778368 RepID=A0ABQ3VQ13_9CHLR|nr:NAD(P)/FAD-dependent oxidoreductase [Dictyobacter formicarum]GHO87786.1 NAD(P)/FAD-dependent oxidoreductase [Dictyobacter formicarum]
MYKQAPSRVEDLPEDGSGTHTVKHFDAIIIGAGLGGLLSAAHLLQRGKHVVVVERLPHCGGRFTAKNFHGVQVSTGAVHMVPFGSSGVLSHMLRRLNVPHRLYDADVFGSFHVHGQQYRSRGLLGVARFLGPAQFFWFLRLGYLMFFRPLTAEERQLPFDLWLERHINVERNPQLVAFFASISRFALSLELNQVSTAEVVRTTKNMFRFGAPAIVEGGCGEITHQLEKIIETYNGEIMLSSEVLGIVQEQGRVTGVLVKNKVTGEEKLLQAPLVVSDIGPRATNGLLQQRRVKQSDVLKQKYAEDHTAIARATDDVQEAVGLKVHILSDVSLIPHKGIMYCLDTKRIAGMVQPTNSDPSLAPAGKHLLISHQVIQSNNVEEERALALADLRSMFGETFDQHCQILTMGTYRGEWPVNRVVQGEDVQPQLDVQGLYLVGDAVKPSGYLMVEGVAQSVNNFLDLLDDLDQEQAIARKVDRRLRRNVMSPPSRLNALRWLWKAPGNSGKP